MNIIKGLLGFLLISIITFIFFSVPIIFGLTNKEKKEIEDKFYHSNSKLFSEQLYFREYLIEEYKRNSLSYYKGSIDSVNSDNPFKTKNDILFLLPKGQRVFSINLDNYTFAHYFAVGYDSLLVTLNVNRDKVETILDNSNPNPVEFLNVLKYQDILDYKTKTVKHLRISTLIIILGGTVFFLVLLSYIIKEYDKRKERKNNLTKEQLEGTKQEIEKDIDLTDDIDKLFNDDFDIEKFKVDYKKKLKEKVTHVEELLRRNKGLFILQTNVDNALAKSKSIDNRSVLMLIAGLIMAFIGMAVFYFSLPKNINPDTAISNILSMSLRPTLILIFIEAIAWYLLRQYRLLIKDNNYFHNVYEKKQNILTAYKLLEEIDGAATEKKYLIPLALLASENTSEITSKEEKSDKENQISGNSILTTIIEKLFPK